MTEQTCAGADEIMAEIVRLDGNLKAAENLMLDPSQADLQAVAGVLTAALNNGLTVFDLCDLISSHHMTGVLIAASQHFAKAS